MSQFATIQSFLRITTPLASVISCELLVITFISHLEKKYQKLGGVSIEL